MQSLLYRRTRGRLIDIEMPRAERGLLPLMLLIF